MTTDFGRPISPPTANQDRSTSASEAYGELIKRGLSRGRTMAVWQDLVSDHGFPHGYHTVKRCSQARIVGIILTASSTTATSSNADADLEDQVAGRTMSTTAKTSPKATT